MARAQPVTKDPENRVDMWLELLDVEALDTGRYHAMVVQDPSDRREIRGFFRMASVWAQEMTGTEDWGPPTQSVIAICNAVQKYTNIRATMAYQFSFDSKELFSTPLVFTRTSNSGFALTASETGNLGKYLKAGGLLFGDEGLHKLGGAGDRAFRLVIQQAMESVEYQYGVHWAFVRLPDAHALYHCYFDFEGGPPMGEDWRNKGPVRYGSTSYPYLEAVHIGQQAVVVYSMKGLLGAAAAWGKWEGYTHLDPTRVHQFFVNVVVFALTQEGSITKRVMDEVR